MKIAVIADFKPHRGKTEQCVLIFCYPTSANKKRRIETVTLQNRCDFENVVGILIDVEHKGYACAVFIAFINSIVHRFYVTFVRVGQDE